jgi:secreted trypsin-like serine protease
MEFLLGPLFCYDKERERYYLSGATSYGYGGIGKSCAAGQLARYTDVAKYVTWIRENIQDTLAPQKFQ